MDSGEHDEHDEHERLLELEDMLVWGRNGYRHSYLHRVAIQPEITTRTHRKLRQIVIRELAPERA